MCIKETICIYTNPVISKRCKFLKHDDRLENILHCLLRLNWIVLINSVKESYESSLVTLNNMICVSVCGNSGRKSKTSIYSQVSIHIRSNTNLGIAMYMCDIKRPNRLNVFRPISWFKVSLYINAVVE